MKIDEIKQHLLDTGWEIGSQQHFYKEVKIADRVDVKARNIRVKFNKVTLTIEMQSASGSYWIRIGGCGYESVRKNEQGDMMVITFRFPGKATERN